MAMHIKLLNQFLTRIFTGQNGKRNILRVQYFMSEDIRLHIKSQRFFFTCISGYEIS